MKSKGAPWATFLEAPGADLTGSWCRAACTEWRRGTGPRHSLGDVVRRVAWRYAHGCPAACVTAASCGPLGRNNLPQEPLQRDVLAAARVHTHTRGGEYGRTLNCWLRGAILHSLNFLVKYPLRVLLISTRNQVISSPSQSR